MTLADIVLAINRSHRMLILTREMLQINLVPITALPKLAEK